MPRPASGVLQGRYRLDQLIGRGGMGYVYRARDEQLGRDVAVKVFIASTKPEDVRRQEDEVNLLASLNHHGLVTLLDAAIDRSEEGRPRIFFVMELVEGADLERRLARGPLTARQIAQIGFDLAEGLQYIHHRGVVHRDIKPSNIMIVDYQDDSTRARAKLTDFGIALVTEHTLSTPEGLTTGTAAYLSPEQVRGRPVGPASDVYSLGLVLLECFTRTLAFPGATPVDSATARLNHDPDIPADLGDDWRNLIAAMTARDPEDRPTSAELVLALRQSVFSETGRHRLTEAPAAAVDEVARMNAVERYGLLDTPPDDTFDRIAAIAARVMSTPVALVSIVDHHRIWFKAHHGLDLLQVDRDPGFCASAITQDTPWIVEDARSDPRTATHPLVVGDFGLQFYAGVPLTTRDGQNLGTLCVLDFEPREVTADQMATLQDLARLAMNALELRWENSQLSAPATSSPPLAEVDR
ncbi:MAG TPA: GAF domain-containing serine/threonine-protein kinase [Lacisediminihabitans sp.]|uniref:GAF domain-containing serine/threonine-protein kinase n=1 Tax=Lacisediminihabitans sp. TaxID=2787631 RepID=UPI002EDA7B86